MKSSSGKYYIGLDHIRALATFMVFSWHFIQIHKGHLAPPPTFPLSVFTEGHTGVALFMTLSGYLFSKLLDNKQINYTAFIWNRFLRLGPLLILVMILVGLQKYRLGAIMGDYADNLLQGFFRPTWPNGGWSITVEFHFYLLLPGLLFLKNKWPFYLILILLLVIASRVFLHDSIGEIQSLSYSTIIGRIDQFLLGILAFEFRKKIAHKHFFAVFIFIAFLLFYWGFDSLGGYYMNPSYPSPSIIWIILPAVEGLCYAILIAWYDNSFNHSTGKISSFIALIGNYSYSIYLLHLFFIYDLNSFVNKYICDLHNIHVAILFSFFSFFLMVPIGYFSFNFIELPFLKFRKNYLIDRK